MKLLKVAAGVLNQTPLDWSGNTQRILKAIDAAKADQVSLLCLPEFCIPGYGCEDAFLAPDTHSRCLQQLELITQHTENMVVCVGLPFLCAGGLFNGVALLANKEIVGIAAKQYLAGDGLHYEPRWFKPWPKYQMVDLDVANRTLPVGDIVFNFQGIRIGFEICEDAWVGARPGANLAVRGVDLILNPSASHFAFGKHEVRRRFVLEGSRAFQVSYIYSNLLGNEAGRSIYDGDAMIASGGKLLALGKRFSFEDVQLTTAIVDVQWTRMLRARTASFQPQISDDRIGDEVDVPFSIPMASLSMIGKADPQATSAMLTKLHNLELAAPAVSATSDLRTPATPSTPLNHSAGKDLSVLPSVFSKEEEFTLAVALGLFDYLRKSRSSGVVVSLSGGADSAGVTLLSWFMLYLSVEQLGLKRTLQKLAHIKTIQDLTIPASPTLPSTSPDPQQNIANFSTQDIARKSANALAGKMIHTVYQATKNSGTVTLDAANKIASLVHSSHHVWDVDAIVNLYCSTVESTLGHPLDWQTDDITLQNIQARSRAPGAWMLANIYNALLLSTSNRSEAAVGYATMDGDTSGGLSPIAGIDKNFLRHWLRWLQESGFPGLGPIAELDCINNQAPTAELRPPNQEQTDEGDLMPYDLLDTIERLAIRDKISPIEVLEHVALQFPQYSPSQLKLWIKRFFTLWSRNQWKRERYAPSFHLDDENLDPKTWCRWPILSGGFEEELKELD